MKRFRNQRENDMKKMILVLVAMFLMTGPAEAGYFLTGNQLLASCESKKDSFGRGECIGFLEAVAGTEKLFKDLGLVSNSYFCIPKGVNIRWLDKIFKKYANDHRHKLHLTATSLVTSAFAASFPCV
jgi:hypothetical protein